MGQATQHVTIEHSKGLHARPATVFVQTANEFDADIDISVAGDENSVNAKSSVQMMSLGAEEGDKIEITASGEDSEKAVTQLVELVKADFELSGEQDDATKGTNADEVSP